MFLVRHAVGLYGDGRNMGPPLFNFCFVIPNVSSVDVVLSGRKYVYAQDHGVCGFSFCDCINPVAVAMNR